MPIPVPSPVALLGSAGKAQTGAQWLAGLLTGTTGSWWRARSHAVGNVRFTAPWQTSAGQADSASSIQSPPGTDFSDYYSRIQDDGGGYTAHNFDPTQFVGRGEHAIAYRPKADYAWMHKSPGMSGFCVFRFVHAVGTAHNLFDSGGYGANTIGVNLQITAQEKLAFSVSNGSGTKVVAPVSEALTPATRYLAEWYWSVDAGYALRVNGSAPFSAVAAPADGMVVGTPSSASPTDTFMFGGAFSAASNFIATWLSGDLYEVWIRPGVLTGAQFLRARTYFASLYGITLAPQILPNVDDPSLTDPRILL